jgi:hypothetical protein
MSSATPPEATSRALAHTEDSAAPALRALIEAPAENIAEIGALFDRLSPPVRLAATRSLDRALQRRLYQKAARSAPLRADHFVPAHIPAEVEVIHHGQNTLPLPRPWKRFEKRFCRPAASGDRLFGYNESPTRGLIGPGYFVLIPTAGVTAWEPRGPLVVDYFQVPDGPVVPAWPKVVPNTRGLQFFVYNKTRDFMRGVSEHVSIGAAYKVESALDHYFVLCRANG